MFCVKHIIRLVSLWKMGNIKRLTKYISRLVDTPIVEKWQKLLALVFKSKSKSKPSCAFIIVVLSL